MKDFERGTKLKTKDGGEVTIIQKLGEGGQGQVYKVNYLGKEMALKWYLPGKMKAPEAFYENLSYNVEKGAPCEQFLWPEVLVGDWEGERTDTVPRNFGYLMGLRPSQYEEFTQYMLAKVRFKDQDAVVNAGLQIIHAFRQLHNAGFSYQDLNNGNFFINPKTGDVLICDNDNVSPEGKNLGIAGKAGYMAPEIVRGEKMPDKKTDRFSLAVILYYLLFMDSPLEGKNTATPCRTEARDKEYFGTNPIFVWDPTDDSNRPVRGVHNNSLRIWPLYPQYVKDMFVKAFSKESMTGNANRPIDKDWEKLFIQMRDSILICPDCRGKTITDVDSSTKTCLNCGTQLPEYRVLHFQNGKNYRIPLQNGKQLFACHTEAGTAAEDDFNTVTGQVVESKNKAGVLGIKNLSTTGWTAVSGETRKSIEPGKGCPVGKGITLEFKKTKAIME